MRSPTGTTNSGWRILSCSTARSNAPARAAGAVGNDGEAERRRVVIEFQLVPGILLLGLDDEATLRRCGGGLVRARPSDERNNRHGDAGAKDAFHGNSPNFAILKPMD